MAMSESASRTEGTSQVAALADDLRRKRAELEDQRHELGVLIKQTSAELDRASQRVREAATQLKQVESNMANFSQSEVKRAYGASQEAQMRQFMMQGQLEQLRNRLAGLEANDELYRQLIGSADDLVDASESFAEDALAASQPPSQLEQSTQALQGAGVAFRTIELALQRLSRQLQDETAQTLSDLILRAEVCERLVDMDKQKAKTEVTRLKQAAAAALKSTRLLAQEMRSPALDDSGLATALRRYVESLKSIDRIQVELQVVGLERSLPRAVEIGAFRVVQEALANTANHSGTKRADLRMRFDPQQLTITVADEGSGFDVESTLQRVRSLEHSGLMDMQIRTELIGGTIEISSRTGSGCMISLAIPA